MYVTDPIYETAIEHARSLSQEYADSLNIGGRSIYTNYVSNQPGGSSGSKGNQGGSNNGPPSWFTSWELKQRNRGRGGGGSGTRFEGANAIPNLTLPPTVTTGAPASGPNPIMIIAVLAALGVGGWYLYHKFHKTAAEDKVASKAADQT